MFTNLGSPQNLSLDFCSGLSHLILSLRVKTHKHTWKILLPLDYTDPVAPRGRLLDPENCRHTWILWRWLGAASVILNPKTLFFKDHRPTFFVPRSVLTCRQGPRGSGKCGGGAPVVCTYAPSLGRPACTAGSGYCGNNARKALVTFLWGQRHNLPNTLSPCWQREGWRAWKLRLGECRGR